MKILQVNKFHYPKAGAEAYLFGLSELLRRQGHEVAFFSMKHPRNLPCPEERFFVDEVDFHRGAGLEKARNALKILYSVEARRRIGGLLDEFRPDIVHLHNFHHQLSPSILGAIRSRGVPRVMTVHDLKIVCPNYLMLSGGKVCERCRKHRYHHCFLQKCVKGSRLGSLVNTLEMTLHWVLGSHGLIDLFLTPSLFYREKLIDWGIEPERVRHIPNFVDVDALRPTGEMENYVVYAGRLSPEKGLLTLLDALARVPDLECRIAGTGDEEFVRLLADRAESLGLRNVRFLGFVERRELQKILSRSRALVLPSEWYENGSIAQLEAMALGKAVIGARIGGIPEATLHKETGLLFEPGDAAGLGSCLGLVHERPDLAKALGIAARMRIEAFHTPAQNVEKVKAAYDSVLGLRRPGRGPGET